MQKNESALILIVLGLIFMAFPILGMIPFSFITGIIVSLVGIGLIFAGFTFKNESETRGIVSIIVGIIALILGIGFIINPSLFSFVASFFVLIAGLFLLAIGIATIMGNFGGDKVSGTVALVLGVIYLAFATLIRDPAVLGTLIGLWLLITGFLMLFQKD